MDISHIQTKLNPFGIKVLSRDKNKDLWKKVSNNEKFLAHYHSNSFLDYQKIYLKKNTVELSFIATKNDDPLFLFPLFFNSNQKKLFNFENFIKLPKISSNDNIKKEIINFLKDYNPLIFGAEGYDLKMLKKVQNCFTLNINLKNEIENIFSSFRKSYKSLIRKKYLDLKMKIKFKEIETHEWDEFHNLHKIVAGKSTRSSDTWNLQKKNILNGSGLLIYFTKEKKLISGSYFDVSKDDIKYSVSVTKDDYFHLNCNHKSIYEAIKFGKKNKKSNIYLGHLNENEQDIKVKNIFFFKKGFGCETTKNAIYKIL